MRDHEGDYRGFYHFGEAWYKDNPRSGDVLDDVHFGYYSPDGGTSGELCMEWVELSRTRSPRINAYDDAWHTLSTFGDVIAALGELDGQDITPRQFCDLLLRLGFVDKTDRENPYVKNDTRITYLTKIKSADLSRLSDEQLSQIAALIS